jgi:hypothetical protein
MSTRTLKNTPKSSASYAKLYSWLAVNNIDIIQDNDISVLEAISKQIINETIDPTNELLEILEGIVREELHKEK